MEKIKLIIWDMDDTFWKGTLSEEKVEIIEENVDIIRKLSERGIINSISSKNNYQDVKNKLMDLKIWDLFVFPKINWEPKGIQVKEIIESAQLRETNVLFIDDNINNLNEVKYYNKEINVKNPEFIKNILNHPSFKGKDDKKLSRLKHYKILETKKTESKKFKSNIEFLEQSNLSISFEDLNENNFDRIYELIHRTNQLNYTKKRINKLDMKRLVNNMNYENKVIRASDRYGDYGIIGYYSLDKKNDKLEHFLFSCRTINLGIEQFVYSHLDYPKIEVEGKVATRLDKSKKPHWINILKYNFKNVDETENNKKINIIIKGGCDLEQSIFYLNNKSLNIDKEFNYVAKNGFPIHSEHSVILKMIDSLDKNEKQQLVKYVPFYDENIFKTRIFDKKYDILIYSVLMDYTMGIYENKNNNKMKIVYGDFMLNLTDYEIYRKATKRLPRFDDSFFNYLKNNYSFKGKLTEEDFYENLNYINNKYGKNKTILFINGSEVNKIHEWEKDRYVHHKKMNKVLEKFVAKTNNNYIIDVRHFINTEEDINDNLRHYSRESYKIIADKINELIVRKYKIKYKKSYKKNISIYIKDLKNNIRSIFNKE